MQFLWKIKIVTELIDMFNETRHVWMWCIYVCFTHITYCVVKLQPWTVILLQPSPIYNANYLFVMHTNTYLSWRGEIYSNVSFANKILRFFFCLIQNMESRSDKRILMQFQMFCVNMNFCKCWDTEHLCWNIWQKLLFRKNDKRLIIKIRINSTKTFHDDDDDTHLIWSALIRTWISLCT